MRLTHFLNRRFFCAKCEFWLTFYLWFYMIYYWDYRRFDVVRSRGNEFFTLLDRLSVKLGFLFNAWDDFCDFSRIGLILWRLLKFWLPVFDFFGFFAFRSCKISQRFKTKFRLLILSTALVTAVGIRWRGKLTTRAIRSIETIR